jgi:cell division protein FtsQ
VLADEEPKYLRRQKPVEIKRRTFGRQAWKSYLRVTVWAAVGLASAGAAYEGGRFLLMSPEMALRHPDQIGLEGNHYVTPESVRTVFLKDRGKSVLRIPIAERRRQLEAIPWVEQAAVRRVLPNRIHVEITERTPAAFLRDGSELGLIDAYGVILERPLTGEFHFPVVTGLNRETPLEERHERMKLLSKFIEEIDSVKPHAADQVSEVDLADPHDLRATLTDLAGQLAPDPSTSGQVTVPVLVHFGDNDFSGKYQTLMSEFGAWQARAGRIESVDLRFSREAVVNQETTTANQARPRGRQRGDDR